MEAKEKQRVKKESKKRKTEDTEKKKEYEKNSRLQIQVGNKHNYKTPEQHIKTIHEILASISDENYASLLSPTSGINCGIGGRDNGGSDIGDSGTSNGGIGANMAVSSTIVWKIKSIGMLGVGGGSMIESGTRS